MANEKLYTAKQAAQAVLEKVGEVLRKSEVLKAETGHEKGVHTSMATKIHPASQLPHGNKGGKSHAGMETAGAHDVRANGGPGIKKPGKVAEVRENTAKKIHRNVLADLRSMPSPSLGKSECSKCGQMHKQEVPTSQNECNEVVQKAEPKGEIHPKEQQAGEAVKPGERVKEQVPPQENTHEQAEGNNEPAGTTPKDGIEQSQELGSHLKLAKFIGRMEQKRVSKQVQATSK